MTLDRLPLVRQIIEIAGHGYAIDAATDQDALLQATSPRDLIPFGLMLWESAIVLADAVAARAVSELCVLDLGAGVGLQGLVAAAGGATVTQIDFDPLALALCKRNVAANGLQAQINVLDADWFTWQPPQRYDLILGADVIYDCENHAAILRLLASACAPGGTILLADPMRLHAIAFMDAFERAGWTSTVRTTATSDLSTPGARVDVQIIEARRAV